MEKRGPIIFALLAIALAFLAPSILAFSNESINAKTLLDNSSLAIQEMQARNIPITRVNESYTEALSSYQGQTALEENKKKADYEIVIRNAQDIIKIKNDAIAADDKLKIFLEEYNSVKQDYDLTEMDQEYNDIIRSFKEERFEDTPALIDKGYQRLSEVQSKQTTLRLFTQTVTKSVKKFLLDNWKWLSALIIICTISIIIFWKTIRKLKIRTRLYNLSIQKDTLYSLIKKLQSDYFKTKNISETEYYSKIDKFKEMIREIDRNIPLLKEDLMKVDDQSILNKTNKPKYINKKTKKRKR